jgi:imidazole glycerol-phosphate synthase subunit HisH
MNNTIGIINYGISGNIHSVEKAIKRVGGSTLVINKPKDFDLVDKIVIPGVGSFKDAMLELKNNHFIKPLKKFDGPLLGICLGMQLMSKLGFEFGKTNGLGFFDGEIKPILCDGKIPHVGFNKIKVISPNILLNGLEEEEFYFMHSYEMTNCENISALTEYSNHSFVSAICHGNIFGVQFHPEKSREAGLKLFKNFIEL